MVGRIIETGTCVSEGAEWLAARHPDFARLLTETGPLPLRRRPDGFAALLDAIIGQQVSTASANAIWAKLEVAGLADEQAMRQASEDDLRACGFSRQKIRYGKALAEARLDYTALRVLPDEDLITTLTALPGIGRWTAEVYAIISLGRADVFAPGDLALQEAARLLFALPERPRDRDLRAMAEAWSPWRAIAARALWAYYRVTKSREGIR